MTSTTRDRHAATTVLDLLPTALVPDGARLYPVGRLDLDSEGLLILTNDGAWSERVLHPRFGVEREYAIGVSVAARRRPAASARGGDRARRGPRDALPPPDDDRGRDAAPRRPPGPRPGRPALVPRDAAPGLEAPAPPDVRRRRRPDRPARPRPDRPGPDRRPAKRPDPAAQGAGGPRPRLGRGPLARRGAEAATAASGASRCPCSAFGPAARLSSAV